MAADSTAAGIGLVDAVERGTGGVRRLLHKTLG